MKTSVALLTLALVAVVLQTSWAKPHPQFSFNIGVGGSINQIIPTEAYAAASYHADGSNNGDVSNSAPQNILENIFNGIDEAIRNASRLGEETTRTFFENIRIASEAFLDNANDLGEAIEDNFRQLVHQNVANFRAIVHAFITGVDQQILAVRNRIKRQALIEVETRLEDLYDSLNGLHGHVEELRVNWQHDVEHQEMIVVRRWNIWAGEQLERIADATNGNEQKIAEAEGIINEFVNRYGNYLTQCADEVEGELEEYEQQVDKTVKQYEPVLASLIEEVEQCLQDRDTAAAGRRCSRQFKQQLGQLRGAPADFAKLTAAGARLALERFENRYCVAQTLIEFGLEKFAVERQLVELVLRQDQTENGDASAESSGSSESQESASSGENSAGSSAEASGSAESDSEESASEGSGSEESTSVSESSQESASNEETVSEASNESASSEESGSEASNESASSEESASEASNESANSEESTSEASNGSAGSQESASEASNESAGSQESASETSNESASSEESASEAPVESEESSDASVSNSESENDESVAVAAAIDDDSSSESESNDSNADAAASDNGSNSVSSDSSDSSE